MFRFLRNPYVITNVRYTHNDTKKKMFHTIKSTKTTKTHNYLKYIAQILLFICILQYV